MNKFYILAITFFLLILSLIVTATEDLSDLSKKDFLLLVENDYYSNECKKTDQFMNLDRLYAEPEAAFFVANCIQQTPYLKEKKISETDASIALKLFEYSATAGYAESALNLFLTYDTDDYGIERDPLKGMDWLREFWRLNKDKTVIYEHELSITQNDGSNEQTATTNIYHEIEQQAKSGNSEAQYGYAKAIDEGKIPNLGLTDAIPWYKKSADNGHEEANFTLGYLYCRGIGVDINKIMANDFFQRSKHSVNCP